VAESDTTQDETDAPAESQPAPASTSDNPAHYKAKKPPKRTTPKPSIKVSLGGRDAQLSLFHVTNCKKRNLKHIFAIDREAAARIYNADEYPGKRLESAPKDLLAGFALQAASCPCNGEAVYVQVSLPTLAENHPKADHNRLASLHGVAFICRTFTQEMIG